MSLLVGGMSTGGKLIITGIRKKTSKSVSTYNSNTKPRKKLQYNHREVSAMILRAKTSFSASLTVSSARTKLVSLSKKAGTGEYDEEELRHAIIHAQSIVRVAKKRLKHLKQEEAEKKAIDDELLELEEEEKEEKESDLEDVEEENRSENEESSEMSEQELRKLMREIEKLMRETMEESNEDEEDIFEEFSFARDVEPKDLELRKKKHRAEELKDIVKADMKYLKFVFGRLESERNSIDSGVSFAIGGFDIPFSPPPPVVTEGGNVDVSL